MLLNGLAVCFSDLLDLLSPVLDHVGISDARGAWQLVIPHAVPTASTCRWGGLVPFRFTGLCREDEDRGNAFATASAVLSEGHEEFAASYLEKELAGEVDLWRSDGLGAMRPFRGPSYKG